MTCRECAEFLADYLADELPAPQREAFDRHLSACANCTRYVDGYRRTLTLTKGAFRADDVPEDLVEAILRARRISDTH